MTTTHQTRSPSKAYRYLACPGSIHDKLTLVVLELDSNHLERIAITLDAVLKETVAVGAVDRTRAARGLGVRRLLADRPRAGEVAVRLAGAAGLVGGLAHGRLSHMRLATKDFQGLIRARRTCRVVMVAFQSRISPSGAVIIGCVLTLRRGVRVGTPP